MAPLFRNFDLTVHYGETVFTIRNVDPDRYSRLDLLDDIYEYAVGAIAPSVGVAVKVYYQLGMVRFEIDTDSELLLMFEIVRKNEIDLFIEAQYFEGIPPPPPPQYEITIPPPPQDDITNDSVPVSEIEVEVECGSSSLSDSEDDSFSFDSDQLSLDSDKVSLDSEGLGLDNVDENQEKSAGECRGEDNGDEQMEGYNSADSCNVFVDFDVNVKRKKKKKEEEIYVAKKGEKIKLKKGLMFENVDHFRELLRDYVIQEGFKLVRDKNERTRVTAHCGSDRCLWRTHASPTSNGITYQIKSLYPSHNCIANLRNVEATSTWIVEKLRDRLRENPDMTLAGMKAELLRKYSIEVSWMQLYRARRKATEQIEGSFKDSYKKLPMFAVEVRRTNPGSIVKIQYERVFGQQNPYFHRMFVCFEAVMTGLLKECRPFISLDGCHLKGPYGGVLLAAIGLDGDEGIFLVAVGIVETENKQSWGFFMDNLQTCIGTEKPWTFMFDGQKGIESAIREFFPGATQRRCVRHLYSNFRENHPSVQLRRLFWAAAKACNATTFRKAMEEIKGIRSTTHEWMMQVPSELWAKHKFNHVVRIDHLTNNFTESFNNWVGELRNKPILTLLEGIKRKMMGRICARLDLAKTWEGVVTQNTRSKLEKLSQESKKCNVIFVGGDEFEVLDRQTRHVVFLDRKTCSCGSWDISGIPCKHGLACAMSRRINMEVLCDPYFSKVKYMETYERIIHPILDESMWVGEELGDPIEPPRLRRLPGRPSKNRRREQDEPTTSTSQQRKWHNIICKNCGQVGHNKRRCHRGPVKRHKFTNKTNSRPRKQIETTSATQGVAPPEFGSNQTPPPPLTQSSVADTQSSAATQEEVSQQH